MTTPLAKLDTSLYGTSFMRPLSVSYMWTKKAVKSQPLTVTACAIVGIKVLMGCVVMSVAVIPALIGRVIQITYSCFSYKTVAARITTDREIPEIVEVLTRNAKEKIYLQINQWTCMKADETTSALIEEFVQGQFIFILRKSNSLAIVARLSEQSPLIHAWVDEFLARAKQENAGQLDGIEARLVIARSSEFTRIDDAVKSRLAGIPLKYYETTFDKDMDDRLRFTVSISVRKVQMKPT